MSFQMFWRDGVALPFPRYPAHQLSSHRNSRLINKIREIVYLYTSEGATVEPTLPSYLSLSLFFLFIFYLNFSNMLY